MHLIPIEYVGILYSFATGNLYLSVFKAVYSWLELCDYFRRWSETAVKMEEVNPVGSLA